MLYIYFLHIYTKKVLNYLVYMGDLIFLESVISYNPTRFCLHHVLVIYTIFPVLILHMYKFIYKPAAKKNNSNFKIINDYKNNNRLATFTIFKATQCNIFPQSAFHCILKKFCLHYLQILISIIKLPKKAPPF